MASIADVYVTVLPETGKIASGIEKALRDVDVKAIAETWKTKIEKVLKGTEADVDIKVDATKAKAEIEKATKDKKVDVKVDANTAKANAQIDHAARDRKATINVKTSGGMGGGAPTGIFALAANLTSQGFPAIQQGAQASSAALGGLSDSFKETSSNASRMGTMVAPAIAALIPALTSLAGVAAAAAGALALLPAAFAAVGAGAGVMMIGLSGITDAYEAVSGAAKSAGKDAADHASKVTSASRTVSSAQQSLSSAVRSETQAQKDVARARRDALHELQDINDELRNGAIDETQAQIDLAQARQELATGTFDSSLDYQQAQLNVIKAEQRLKEAHEGNNQLQQESNDKRAKGVEGADEVVAAEQRLADAQQATANAQTALADAQVKLTEANNDVSTSAQKAADAMGLLAPAGQEFVNSLMALTPVWNQFKQDLQQPLLAGLGETLTNTVNALLPAITPGLQRIAGAFNTAFKGIGEWLQKPENLAMISGIVDNIATAFENLGPAVQPFLTAITTLVSTGSGFLPELATGLSNAANSFANFITQAAASGSLQQFIQTGLDTLGQLGEIMPHVVNLFESLVPLGVTFTPILVDLTNKFLDFMASCSDLWTILEQISPVLQITIPFAFNILTGAISGVVNVLQFLMNVFNFVKDLFINIKNLVVEVANAFKDFLAPYIDAARVIIEGLWHAIENAFPVIKTLENTFRTVWGAIKGFFDDAKGWMGSFFNWVKEMFINWIPWPVRQIIKKVWPEWGGGGGDSGGLPTAGPGQDVSPTRAEDRTSGGAGTPALPGGPTPATPPGTPPGTPAVPAPSTTVATDGTRVFVTNWPTGGVGGGGGGGGGPTVAGPPGAPVPGGGVPLIQGPNGTWTSPNAAWAALIKRESGGNPTIVQGITDANSGGNEASGLFQIAKSTWLANGGGEFAPTAGEAPPDKQAIVAARIFNKNPTGRDWGAGLPGRENAADLAAGLGAGTPVPMAGTGVGGGLAPAGAPGVMGTAVPFGITDPSQLASIPWVQQLESQYGLSANTRAGHQTSNRAEAGFAPNPQGLIRGIDWNGTPAQLEAFAQALIANPSGIEQLIYMSPLSGKKYGIAGGKVVGDDYYAGDWAGHTDHVHTRSARSLTPGVAAATDASSQDLGATGGPTGISTAGDSHTIGLNPNVPLNQQGNKGGGKDYGKQLGQDIVSGMMEIFGLGDVFPDPTQFGLFKIFKSLMAVKPGGGANGGSTGAGGGSGGGGDPFMDLLGSLVPNANGTGGILGAWVPPPGGPDSGAGAGAPPGNVDNSFNVTVQGDAGPKAQDNMNTEHITHLRNTGG